MKTTDFPTIPPGLVERLEALFPPKCPALKDTEREMFLYAGKVEMVRFLRARCDEQLSSSEEKGNNISIV